MLLQDVEWDQALIEKYNSSSPRYTSYPTALEFTSHFTEEDFRVAAYRYPTRPLSLYLHIPFCHQLCYFCGCNKVVTRHPEKAERYLQQLIAEIRQRATLFTQRTLTQIHFGGGTPTFLSDAQLAELMQVVRDAFSVEALAEISLELDPRQFPVERLVALRRIGFNRLSMGVQDFNPVVQRRVNREQDEAQIVQLISTMKTLGFTSTNIDLIYGLPQQTAESFGHTIDRVLALRPDRMSVFNYAHMPELFAAQRKIKSQELPTAAQKLTILQQTIDQLQAGGYQFIGMDHFALPEDELARAQRAGTLQRNFQGYTTQRETDLLGVGVSAISMVGDTYSQNEKTLNDWSTRLAESGSALCRGISLSAEDMLRRDLIKALMCQFSLDIRQVESRIQQPFTHYFAEELRLLSPMIEDGLLTLTSERLQVTARGRLLVRHLCLCFDHYSRQRLQQQAFSRVI
ncbi:oxygen-independent coproporphyrinogen III oxidase [Rosenbergiella sp. S61]|uniref:Coproporphyrinogen-III oxidase n=1 Tax=Rosenbergiella gaditana TaxID=2726987 RepID=A0ABS5T0L4_9GAMM|nr:oxygen-independent coproporphyrinogen III oxidase [Rosenbergiella gaditana]MBT0724558.1 oxygen-independent coproporphyrinogen III oxidase [Rosenbergiella gaditana]